MKKIIALLAASTLLSTAAQAADIGTLTVTSTSLKNDQPIPPMYAYCMPDGHGQSKDGGNISPQLRWSGAPAATKSYALVVVDPDVPASFDSANKVGKVIPADDARQNFYHWILLDIPANVTSIAEGQDSKKVLAGGKPTGKTAYGTNGKNDYAKFYGGSYGGYDGPCPPWNDERVHHYHFDVYALDVDTLKVDPSAKGADVEAALANHTLAKGELVGTYTQNQQLLLK